MFEQIIQEMVYNPVRFNIIVLSIGVVYFGLLHWVEVHHFNRKHKPILGAPTPAEHQVTKAYIDNLGEVK